MTDAPVPSDLVASVRKAMYEFVNAAGNRRVLPPVFHVGRPGGRPGAYQYAIADEVATQAGLRADLVERALDGLLVEDPCAWITRSGSLTPTDPDVAWFAASREAFGRHGLELPAFLVITRAGWINLMAEQALPQPGVRPRRRRTKERPASA